MWKSVFVLWCVDVAVGLKGVVDFRGTPVDCGAYCIDDVCDISMTNEKILAMSAEEKAAAHKKVLKCRGLCQCMPLLLSTRVFSDSGKPLSNQKLNDHFYLGKTIKPKLGSWRKVPQGPGKEPKDERKVIEYQAAFGEASMLAAESCPNWASIISEMDAEHQQAGTFPKPLRKMYFQLYEHLHNKQKNPEPHQEPYQALQEAYNEYFDKHCASESYCTTCTIPNDIDKGAVHICAPHNKAGKTRCENNECALKDGEGEACVLTGGGMESKRLERIGHQGHPDFAPPK